MSTAVARPFLVMVISSSLVSRSATSRLRCAFASASGSIRTTTSELVWIQTIYPRSPPPGQALVSARTAAEADQQRQSPRSSLPEYSHQPRVRDVGVTRDERQGQASRRRAHERIERVIIRARVVREVDVLGDEIECLIGGGAEEIGEELTQGSPEIDAPQPGKEA